MTRLTKAILSLTCSDEIIVRHPARCPEGTFLERAKLPGQVTDGAFRCPGLNARYKPPLVLNRVARSVGRVARNSRGHIADCAVVVLVNFCFVVVVVLLLLPVAVGECIRVDLDCTED
jgi:hypothetical protein